MHHRALGVMQRLALTLVCLSTFTATAGYADAAVVINEVAWSGTDADSADEWMELYNTADEPADITDWSLVNDRSLHIKLSGVIAPRSYILLKRTDETGLSIPADQIYAGALPDDCSALVLADAHGNTQDTVLCEKNGWPAGDVKTHASMERINPFVSGSFAENWVTAAAPGASVRDKKGNPILGTPKAQNTGYDPKFFLNATPNSTPVNTAPSTSSSGQNVAALSPASPQWHIAFIGENDAAVPLGHLVTTSNNAVTVRAQTEDATQKIGTVHWNLGNSVVKTGTEARIIYEYPGEYVLAVTASKVSGAQEIPVTVYEPQVHLAQLHRTKGGSGDWLTVNNPMPYQVDVSGWSVHYGATHYEFPDHTVLAPQANAIFSLPASMRIAASTTITFDFPGDIPFEQIAIADVPEDEATLLWAGNNFVWNAQKDNGSAFSYHNSSAAQYAAGDSGATSPSTQWPHARSPLSVANNNISLFTAPALFSARPADVIITDIIPRVFAASLATDAHSSASVARPDSTPSSSISREIANNTTIDDNTVLTDGILAASSIAAAGLMGVWVYLRRQR